MNPATLRALKRPDILLPPQVLERLRDFLLDKRTGNVRLNIRDGVILGFHVEEHIVVRRKN